MTNRTRKGQYAKGTADEAKISPDLVRTLLEYQPHTGALTWAYRTTELAAALGLKRDGRLGRWNNRYAGTAAFTATMSNGYRTGAILCRNYLAHRVIWAIVHGYWPENDIDHRNGIRSDNRLCNLREATRGENMQNQTLRRDNKTGRPGVSWSAHKSAYVAQIRAGGVTHYLGLFHSVEHAAAAYEEAKKSLHSFAPLVREAVPS